MNVAGIIPARYLSSRLPGKPLISIGGKPMIERVYLQALKSKLINEVIVATDDQRIVDCVKNFGGKVILTSADHESGTDRICEAVENINCEVVVNIQGDEPFIDPDNIDLAIEAFKDSDVNVSTLAVRIKDISDLSDTNKVKVVFDKHNNALYFSRSCIPYSVLNLSNSDLEEKKYYKHIGLYAFSKDALINFSKMSKSSLEETERLEQLRLLENGQKIKVMLTDIDSISIDTQEDADRANFLLNKK